MNLRYTNERFGFLAWMIGLLILAGCAPSPAQAVELPLAPTPVPLALVEDKSEPLAEQPPSRSVEAEPVPPLEEEPLQFTFPKSAAEAVSAWRPPLVPVPWALTLYDHFYFTRPIATDAVNWPSADYRYGDFFTDTDIVHTGIDIAAGRGTPVIAAAAGKVAWAGEGLYKGGNVEGDPYGLAVAIRHNFSYNEQEVYTIYAHMDRVDVAVGQNVEAGEQVGIVGTTGKTTGPHLHFEVRIESNNFFYTRNPELWLAPPQGWGVLVGKMIDRYGFPLYKIKIKVISEELGKTWVVRTYGPTSVNKDDFYQENLVLSDLPTGEYWVEFRVRWKDYRHKITIKPGMVTYFNFLERPGTFSDALPAPGNGSAFEPAALEPVVNPVVNP